MGLLVRNIGDWVKNLTVPALAIVMVVSLTRISLRSLVNDNFSGSRQIQV